MHTLFDTIQQLCARRGITGYRLADDLGISKSILTDLKMGRKKGLSADIAAKIADYFGVSVSYLLTGNEHGVRMLDTWPDESIWEAWHAAKEDKARRMLLRQNGCPAQLQGEYRRLFLPNEKASPDEDAELGEYLEELRDRPEMKMLFSLAKNATKEDVEAAVRIIKAYLNKDCDS